MRICNKCLAEEKNGVCRLCNKSKYLRDAKYGDCIYITMSNILFSRMIEDVFDEADIKYLKKSEQGSAVSLYIGSANETYKYYVMLDDYDRAKEIIANLPADISDEELEEYIDMMEE